VAKKVRAVVTLQLPAGKATPAPPVGTRLGGFGIALVNFVKEYNERTSGMAGQIIPVQITIFEDRSYTFILKTPPAADMLRKAAGVDKGSGTPSKDAVGTITVAQLREIAQTKLKDLNAYDIDTAMHIVAGTARTMGIRIQGRF
jgi:large subunit ribosomal protein L11